MPGFQSLLKPFGRISKKLLLARTYLKSLFMRISIVSARRSAQLTEGCALYTGPSGRLEPRDYEQWRTEKAPQTFDRAADCSYVLAGACKLLE
jgi:hypothetical protein